MYICCHCLTAVWIEILFGKTYPVIFGVTAKRRCELKFLTMVSFRDILKSLPNGSVD